jgi:hypothetical protein
MHALVGRLSGIRNLIDIVAACKYATVHRHFGAAAVLEGECGPCSVFALYPGISLTPEENSRKRLSA